MAELKTRKTAASVDAFLTGVDDDQVRQDCRTIADIMAKATKAEPKMWGSAIVGFGTRRVKYSNGREADWMVTAFSPRKQNIVLYLSASFPERDALLKALGKHSCGKGCVYIKRLSDVHLPTLRKMIAASVRHAGRQGTEAS
jgi:hypothetical protein